MALRAKLLLRCKPLPLLAAGGAAAASGSRRRPATRPPGEEPPTMDDLDPAAGVMPMSGEESCEQPSRGRRRGRPKGSRNKATLALEAVLEGSVEELGRV